MTPFGEWDRRSDIMCQAKALGKDNGRIMHAGKLSHSVLSDSLQPHGL